MIISEEKIIKENILKCDKCNYESKNDDDFYSCAMCEKFLCSQFSKKCLNYIKITNNIAIHKRGLNSVEFANNERFCSVSCLLKAELIAVHFYNNTTDINKISIRNFKDDIKFPKSVIDFLKKYDYYYEDSEKEQEKEKEDVVWKDD